MVVIGDGFEKITLLTGDWPPKGFSMVLGWVVYAAPSAVSC